MTTEMPKDQMKPQVSPAQADIVEQATESMLGPNPFVGLRLETLLESYRELGEQAARHPALALEQTAVLFRELIAVLSGSSTLAPAADDKRFGSNVWRENSFYRIYLQSYLAWSASLENFVDGSSLDADNKARAQWSHKTQTRQQTDHLLKDLLFDDAGHRMIATHATKAGIRYRYYVSQPGLHGEARTAQLGSISRVPAPEIEQAIISGLQKHIAGQGSGAPDRNHPIDIDHNMLASLASRIEVQRTRLVVSLKSIDQSTDPDALSIPWQKPPSKRFRKILLPQGALRENVRPERPERRARLVSAIARGRQWLDELHTGAILNVEQLAKRERCTVRQVNLTLLLAFLAPSLVRTAVEGRLPRGINIERLRDPDPTWATQFQDLGLSPN